MWCVDVVCVVCVCGVCVWCVCVVCGCRVRMWSVCTQPTLITELCIAPCPHSPPHHVGPYEDKVIFNVKEIFSL